MQPCILEPKSVEASNLKIAAIMLTKFDQFNRAYTVENTYFDFGQNWKWTTIIAYLPKTDKHTSFKDSYQALNPKEWDKVVSAKTADNLMSVISALLIRINSKS